MKNSIFKLSLLLTMILAFLLSACGQAGTNWQKRSDMTGHSADDSEMQNAIAIARETLPQFWAALEKADETYHSFSIKAGLPANGGGLEHIWIIDLAKQGEEISGFLNNEPADMPGYQIGDRVIFTKDEVTDWQYVADGKVEGHFTTRVLIESMSPEKAQETREMLGWDK